MNIKKEIKLLEDDIKCRIRYMNLPADTFPGRTDFLIFKAETDRLEAKLRNLKERL